MKSEKIQFIINSSNKQTQKTLSSKIKMFSKINDNYSENRFLLKDDDSAS